MSTFDKNRNLLAKADLTGSRDLLAKADLTGPHGLLAEADVTGSHDLLAKADLTGCHGLLAEAGLTGSRGLLAEADLTGSHALLAEADLSLSTLKKHFVLEAYANLDEEQQAEVREAIQATLPEPVGSFQTANQKMQAALPYVIGFLALVELVAQVIMWVQR